MRLIKSVNSTPFAHFITLVLQKLPVFGEVKKRKHKIAQLHFIQNICKTLPNSYICTSHEAPKLHVTTWDLCVDLCEFILLFFPPQISFCIRKGRRPLHHPLRSTSASVRTGQIESPRRKSSSLSRYEDEIHDTSHLFTQEGVQGHAILLSCVVNNEIRHCIDNIA